MHHVSKLCNSRASAPLPQYLRAKQAGVLGETGGEGGGGGGGGGGGYRGEVRVYFFVGGGGGRVQSTKPAS